MPRKKDELKTYLDQAKDSGRYMAVVWFAEPTGKLFVAGYADSAGTTQARPGEQ